LNYKKRKENPGVLEESNRLLNRRLDSMVLDIVNSVRVGEVAIAENVKIIGVRKDTAPIEGTRIGSKIWQTGLQEKRERTESGS